MCLNVVSEYLLPRLWVPYSAYMCTPDRSVIKRFPAGNWSINPGAIAGDRRNRDLYQVLLPDSHNYTVTNAAAALKTASANVVSSM